MVISRFNGKGTFNNILIKCGVVEQFCTRSLINKPYGHINNAVNIFINRQLNSRNNHGKLFTKNSLTIMRVFAILWMYCCQESRSLCTMGCNFPAYIKT